MQYSLLGTGFVIILFLSILASLCLGRYLANLQTREVPEKKLAGILVVEGAIFGLMGLLVAFTFASAHTKLDNRRHLIIEEANAIGTAYLRLDLLPIPARTQLQRDFKQYTDMRIQIVHHIFNNESFNVELDKTHALQQDIWRKTVAHCQTSNNPAICMLTLPALNNMFDIANTRMVHMMIHMPMIVFALLIIVALLGSLLAGYHMSGKRWAGILHIASYAAIMAFTIYIIVDMEYPRIGFIRIDLFDKILIETRNNMN